MCTDVTELHSNMIYLCGNMDRVIFPCAPTEMTSDLGVDTGLIYWCSLATCKGRPQTMLTPYLKELILPCIFRSVAFIRCNGCTVNYEWRTTLWMMRMMQIIRRRFLRSSLLCGGISHQGDEGCFTQKCKIRRLEAAARDCHRHLD